MLVAATSAINHGLDNLQFEWGPDFKKKKDSLESEM